MRDSAERPEPCGSLNALLPLFEHLENEGLDLLAVLDRAGRRGQQLPFVIAVVALEGGGGVRMISNVVGASPDELAIGLPVELVWEDMSTELALPRFRPVREGGATK